VSSAPPLSVRDLRKHFGAVKALDGVDLTVQRGEVHGLVGTNGSGKSTLVKILTGVHRPDSGSVHLWGERAHLPIVAPKKHRISVVHQDIGLVDEISIFDNVCAFAGYGARAFAPISEKRQRADMQRLADELELDLDLGRVVAGLEPSERALVGLLRALFHIGYPKADCLLILDEPTAYLPTPEAARVVKVMRTIAASGSAVIFISHRLSEVIRSTDSVSVMRDGRLDSTVASGDITETQLVARMLGRELEEFYPSREHIDLPTHQLLLEVCGISGETLRDTDFVAYSGEIVGITGLVGMGQDELPYLLSGVKPLRSGHVVVRGQRSERLNPKRARQLGIALIPGHRLRQGLWAEASVSENITLPVLSTLGNRWRRSDSAERILARRWIDRLDIKTRDENSPVASLSGGNQQKVVFGKWLNVAPSVVLLHEPTHGVDAGAKREILELLVAEVDRGACAIVCSGDHEELAAICDRVIAVNHGLIVGELRRPELTTDRLMRLCQAVPLDSGTPGEVG